MVDGDEDRSSVCIGKYKGHGRVTGVLDQGVLYYLPNLNGSYKVRLNHSPREYVIEDDQSWYYLDEDTSDESTEIQEGVAEGKEREIKRLMLAYFNACQGQDQAQKDALFQQLDPSSKNESTVRCITLNNVSNVCRWRQRPPCFNSCIQNYDIKWDLVFEPEQIRWLP